MLLVAEDYRSGLFDFDRDICDLVALNAIIETEGPLAIMAGATGFSLSHIRHGVTALASEVEDGIMTGLAVVLDAILFEMLGMVEDDLAEIGDVESDIFDIDRINKRAGNNRHDQDEKQVPLLHDCLQKIITTISDLRCCPPLTISCAFSGTSKQARAANKRHISHYHSIIKKCRQIVNSYCAIFAEIFN
jgi:hypothetical protein